MNSQIPSTEWEIPKEEGASEELEELEDPEEDELDGGVEDVEDDEDLDGDDEKGPKLQRGKNYITRIGIEKLKSEYHDLYHGERPKLVETIAWAAGNGDRSENADYIYGKRRLREIDKRLQFLAGRLEKAVVVDVGSIKSDHVAFGATVTLEDEGGKQVVYQIVGEDESDAPSGKISWLSPMAQALMGKRSGEEVVVVRPVGEKVYTLLNIVYRG